MIGLPVPPIFLYIDDEYHNLVIDGQQRLVSIRYFFEGYFGEADEKGKRRVFSLEGLSPLSPYRGATIETLTDRDARKLRSYVLRSINIRQLNPQHSKPTSVFHIFERLNTGGTPLKSQEIRNCVFAGPIVQHLRKMNTNIFWKKIIGNKKDDKYQRDIELILRIMSFTSNWKNYEPPLKDHLSLCMRTYQKNEKFLNDFSEKFSDACQNVVSILGEKPFHLRGPLNAAVLDTVMSFAVAHPTKLHDGFKARFEELIANEKFRSATERATADRASVATRFQMLFS